MSSGGAGEEGPKPGTTSFTKEDSRRCQIATIIGKYLSTFIEDSRKRKSTTKIELMDEDEEM